MNKPSSSAQIPSILTGRNYEAESLSNTFILTTIETCFICSGGKKVSNIGYNHELIFEKIMSSSGGLTTIVFYYTTDRLRFAEISINDQSSSINVTFPAMFENQLIASASITINLCQGSNTLRIYNRNGYTPDFDRIVVY